MEAGAPTGYPVAFSVDYPDRPLNRLTTGFRIFVAIPILIVAGCIGGNEGSAASEHGWRIAGGTGGLLFLAPLLMILFRQKYPRWWFDWNRELLRFSNRSTSRFQSYHQRGYFWRNRIISSGPRTRTAAAPPPPQAQCSPPALP